MYNVCAKILKVNVKQTMKDESVMKYFKFYAYGHAALNKCRVSCCLFTSCVLPTSTEFIIKTRQQSNFSLESA